jgi:hypothetical protein
MIINLLSDRISIFLTVAVLVVIFLTGAAALSARGLADKNDSLRKQLGSIRSLSEEVFSMKRIVDSREKKVGLTDSTGAVSSTEKILSELGLRADVLKPSEKKPVAGFVEEDVELEIVGLDLNSIVNLLYHLENTPKPVKIKKAFMKTSFDDPDKFILKVTASVISKE